MKKKKTPDTAAGQTQATSDELLQFVLGCLDRGSSQAEIRKQLMAMGVPAPDANHIVQNVANWRKQNPSGSLVSAGDAGKSAMAIGFILCAVGIAVTILTYMIARSGGGTYFVAWGAIIFGALMFIRGASQSQLAKQAREEFSKTKHNP